MRLISMGPESSPPKNDGQFTQTFISKKGCYQSHLRYGNTFFRFREKHAFAWKPGFAYGAKRIDVPQIAIANSMEINVQINREHMQHAQVYAVLLGAVPVPAKEHLFLYEWILYSQI